MKFKRISILIVLFTLAKLLESCFIWNCPEPKTYDVFFTDAQARLFDTKGFYETLIADSVQVTYLAIEVWLNDERKEIIANNHPFRFTNSDLYAFECGDDKEIYNDLPIDLRVFTCNEGYTNKTDVTDQFHVPRYDDNYLTVREVYSLNELLDYLVLEVTDSAKIVGELAFIIDVELASGKVLSDTSQLVTIY